MPSTVTDRALEIRLFGGVHIALGDHMIHESLMPKVRLLLCYLIMTRRVHSRLSLATLFWGEMSEEKALANLRNALGNLKAHMGDCTHITRHSVCFMPTYPFDLDIEQFYSALQITPDERESTIQSKLNRAIELYTGEFLEGVVISNAPRFEEWMFTEREKLRMLILHVLHELTEQCIESKDVLQGISLAMRQLEIEPSLEEAYLQLMILLTMSGQRSAALMQYHRCEQALLECLNVKPSAELRMLHDQIAGIAVSNR